jgi:homoserine kinase type II
VEAACEAVAHLHESWSASTEFGPCPGVQNRLRILAENEPLLRAGPDALRPVSPALDPLLRRAVTLAAQLAPRLVSALLPWEHQRFTLQPCVRDLRAEHVLLENTAVVGIIDFGAVGVDHPAVDLARLLDDYSQENPALFPAGVATYRRVRSKFDTPETFVRLLAETGALCSVLGWIVRLIFRRETIFDVTAMQARLTQRIIRVEQITHF